MPATQLVIELQPKTPTHSGDDFLVPVVVAKDGSGNIDSSFNAAVTATWVNETGTGVLGGTTSVFPLVGRSRFFDLFVTSAAGCTGHFVFSATGLTSATSSTITITPPVVATKIGYGTRIQGDGYTGVMVYFKSPSQDNFIAATGQPFDYRILIEAQDASGQRDTTYAGTITATVAIGTCTLGGTVSRACVNGRADFSDLKPATGTGPLSITFSGGGLTPFTTAVMNVVTPEWDIYEYAPGQFILFELPRLTVDKSYPTVFSAEYTVDPSGANTGNNRTTVQGIIDKIVADNPSGDVRVKVTPGTYNGLVTLKSKAATTGLICFEPFGGIPGTAGKRITPAEVAAAGVKFTCDTSNNYVVTTDGLAHHYRISGIEITPSWALASNFSFAIVAFADGQNAVNPASPDTIYQVPHHNGLDRCWIHGLANRGLRKGVNDEGSYNFMINCYIDEVHAVRVYGQGSGDENGFYSIAGVGPTLLENNMIRASGETILSGGSNPRIFDRRTSDLTIRRNVVQAPLEWQTLYMHKNNTEFKVGRRVLLERNIFDGAWNGNQDGTGIRFGSGNQYGGVIDNYEGCTDCVFRWNFIRNMQALFSLFEQISPDSLPLKNVSWHDNLAVNINDPTTWINGDGSRASAPELTQIGNIHASSYIAMRHNTHLASRDPTTKYVRAVYFTADAPHPSPFTYYRDNISDCQGYGVITSNDGIGSASFNSSIPDGGSLVNVFITGPTSDANNYAAGAAHGTGISTQGVQFPPEAYYPALISDVGFVDPTIASTWDVADPVTVIAALTLASSSAHKSVASDGSDPGADMTTLGTMLTGVLNGDVEGTSSGGGGGPVSHPAALNRVRRRYRLV